MRSIDRHLGLLSSVRVSNVWLLADGDRTFLIDTGHPLERFALRFDLARAGIRGPGDLDGVLLTHRHSDHAGNAAWLRRTFGCPVIAHERDAEILIGEAPAPKLVSDDTAWWARWLCHIEDRFPARVEVDVALSDGEQFHGLRTYWSPGHTIGSVLLHHEQSGTLFSGDSIVGGPPVVRVVERMRVSYDDFSEDGPQARDSVRSILGRLPPTRTLCAGHGPVVCSAVQEKLEKLTRRDALFPAFAD